jgi:hypothetical protein
MEVCMTLGKFPEQTIRFLPMLLGLSLACPGAVHAIDRNAYNIADLNKHFAEAQANPQNSYTIYLRSTTPYRLTQTLTLTQGTVYLRSGPGTLSSASQYILDGNYPNYGGWVPVIRVFKDPSSPRTPYLSISGITIKGGIADQMPGGGVYVNNASVSVTNSIIRNNASTRQGAGLAVEGASGYLYVYNSIIRDNKNLYAAPSAGNPNCGGLMAMGGGLTVMNGANLSVNKSTVMGNQSCRGGGIAAYLTSGLDVMNTTISGNKANLTGGGLVLYGAGNNINATLNFNTISENKAGVAPTGGSNWTDEKYGGGIAFMFWQGILYSTGNILAKNQTVNSNKATLFYDGHDCFDKSNTQSLWNRSASWGWNFVGALANCTGIFNHSDGWWYAGWEGAPADPLLGSLTQKTGTAGPQYTHAPLSNSLVIGNYSTSSPEWTCPYDDQLGHRRDYYQPNSWSPTRCDFGAHQYNWYH